MTETMQSSELRVNPLVCITRDRVAHTVAAGIVAVAVVIGASLGWFIGLVILCSYATGVLACLYLQKQIQWLTSLVASSMERKPAADRKKPCSVCKKAQCSRHRLVSNYYHQTTLPEPVDTALQKVLEQILKQFIEQWHSKVTEDPGFELQLRLSMQSAISAFVSRFSQVDDVQIITDRLIPAAVSHFDHLFRSSNVLEEQDIGLQAWPIGDDALNKLVMQWHPATLSRQHELLYLRSIAFHMLPFIAPPHQLNCNAWSNLIREIMARWILLPAMDLLSDATILMRVLTKILDPNSLPHSYSGSQKFVPTLRNFISDQTVQSNSCLRVGLTTLMHERELLYPFMQFLKRMGVIHVLQFCLDVEEFNDAMLNPDITAEQQRQLYHSAWDVFSLYFLPTSPDSVGFSPDIVKEMRNVLEEGEKNIQKLRNTPPLFQAYDWAYSKLEKEFLPLFHHSEEYFITLCGGRLSKIKKKHPKRLQGEDWLGVSRPNDGTGSAAYADIKNDFHLDGSSGLNKNLSAWRVSVPKAYLKPDIPGSSRNTAIMVIVVQRIDVHEEDDPDDFCWTLYRSHADLCALQAKLQEFHGEFNEVNVAGAPIRRTLTLGLDSIETWRADGEDYLQLLLQTPALQSSDLLGAFLSPEITDFADVVGGAELTLSRVLRNVRLHRENGQHLEPFLSNMLIASRRHPKPRKQRDDEPPVPLPPPLKKMTLAPSKFGNNLNVTEASGDLLDLHLKSINPGCESLVGIYDCISYLVVRMFGAPKVLSHIILSCRVFLQTAVDTFYQRKLRNKLHVTVGPAVVVQLLHLLQDEVSSSRESSTANDIDPSGVEYLLQRAIPRPLMWLPRTKRTLTAFISALHNPVLNKQLAYTLLDIVVDELFPELSFGHEGGDISH